MINVGEFYCRLRQAWAKQRYVCEFTRRFLLQEKRTHFVALTYYNFHLGQFSTQKVVAIAMFVRCNSLRHLETFCDVIPGWHGKNHLVQKLTYKYSTLPYQFLKPRTSISFPVRSSISNMPDKEPLTAFPWKIPAQSQTGTKGLESKMGENTVAASIISPTLLTTPRPAWQLDTTRILG